MKKLLTLTAIAIMALLTTSAAYAYSVNGLVDDWGVNLSASGASIKGYLDNALNKPTGATVNVITEDNADKNSTWTLVGPGYSYLNNFDVEALYFDNDLQYAYIAVITGLPKSGINPPGNSYPPEYDGHYFKPGDIAINVDTDSFYEFGLDIDTGILYSVNSWTNAVYTSTWGYPDVYNPWIINQVNGSGWNGTSGVQFAYSNGTSGQNTHYVLEARIPLSILGYTTNYGDPIQNIGIHWGMECGNDYLNLDATVNPNHTPEPTSIILLGLGLAGLASRKLRRNS